MGVEAFKQGDFDTAVDAFTEAHTLQPGLPIPPYNIACCHAKLGAPPTSVSWLRTALALQRMLDESGAGAGAGVLAGEEARQAESAAPIATIGVTEVLDDPDFDAIHSHPLFEALLREETSKPDPAAATVSAKFAAIFVCRLCVLHFAQQPEERSSHNLDAGCADAANRGACWVEEGQGGQQARQGKEEAGKGRGEFHGRGGPLQSRGGC
jgi:hypothetical protein